MPPALRLLPLLLLLPSAALSDGDSGDPQLMAPPSPAILIVGAGISGLTAAEKLHNHGFQNIKILEATERTGGRIYTQKYAKGLIEIGAQWIHGPSPGNPIFQLASQYGLLGPDALREENQKTSTNNHPPTLPVVYTSSGVNINAEVQANIIEMFLSWVEQARNFTNIGCKPEDSVGSFIQQKIVNISQKWDKEQVETNMALLRSLLNMECCLSGTHSMDYVALCPFGEYTMLPGIDCTFPTGFESLINHIKAPIPSGTVLLNKAVKRIQWDGSFHGSNSHLYPVKLECEDGDSFVADHVIVTVPLGFLKKQSTDFFSPALPSSKMQAIKNLGFGTNNKILVEFEKPFWDPNTTLIQIMWEGDSPLIEPKEDLKQYWIRKLSIFVVLEPPAQLGHVLCGFIAGKEAEFMETLPYEEVLSSMTDLFRRITGNPELPPPISILRSQWYSHPYTGGSYSYVAVSSSGIDQDNLAEPLPTDKDVLKGLLLDPKDLLYHGDLKNVWSHHGKDHSGSVLNGCYFNTSFTVLFAGEATERNFYSTTHGALISGRREAQRLIDRYPEIGVTASKAKL